MRAVSFIIIFLLALDTQAEEYAVFEKDGFYGIKDHEGQVIVPPVYDQLGWSDHSQSIHSNIVGFKENGAWGLISAKNKIISEAKYHSIVPFDKNHFKASIKGRFSNQLFHGLLDSSGKTKVSFNFFSLTQMGSLLLVSMYETHLKFGVVDYHNNSVIPPIYKSIRLQDNLFYAYQFNSELDLYSLSGSSICQGLDSINRSSQGFIGYKNGYAGFISTEGVVLEDFINKDIEISDGILLPISFPKWGIYHKSNLILELEADSLKFGENALWTVYINGTHHLASPDSSFQFKDSFLMDISEDHYLLKDSRSGNWSAFTKQHERVLQEKDSIVVSKYALWAQKEGVWELYNRYGKKKNRFTYQTVESGIDNQFIIQRGNHWGIMDPLGKLITPTKYDAIEKIGGYYRVNYLGRQGIFDKSGDWIVRAEYSKVYVFKELFVARKGYSYAYFNKEGLIRKSTLEPMHILGEALVIKSNNFYGLMDLEGNILVEPESEKIELRNTFYQIIKDSSLYLIDKSGAVLFGSALEIEDTAGLSEELFLIKKNGRWGFFDFEGRLRIGNRYDSAQMFRESYAAVKINGKWGYINKEERLAIQPYYDEVNSFDEGLSIVRINDKYGLIDKAGNEIVKIGWKEVSKLPTGNFLLRDEYDNVGLISNMGQILLRPAFTSLIDFGDKVLISKNGKQGVLDYTGNQIFKIAFKEIKISDDYTILKY